MVKRHQKRISLPRTWPVKRKVNKWIVKPLGPHKKMYCVSVNTFLREMVKLAKTRKDVKNILHKKGVLVEGRPIKEEQFCVGLMDVIEIPVIKEGYRIILNSKGKLDFTNAKEKLTVSKIIGKKNVAGKTQLNLFGGENFIVDKDTYKVGDSIVIDLDKKAIKDHLKLSTEMTCFLSGGKHIGGIGKVTKMSDNKATIKTKEGEFETLKNYVYIVGKEKPVVGIEK